MFVIRNQEIIDKVKNHPGKLYMWFKSKSYGFYVEVNRNHCIAQLSSLSHIDFEFTVVDHEDDLFIVVNY
jgi:hypothetical protein